MRICSDGVKRVNTNASTREGHTGSEIDRQAHTWQMDTSIHVSFQSTKSVMYGRGKAMGQQQVSF